MNTNNTTIVVDAMGGDNSPQKIIYGIDFAKLKKFNI